MPLNEIEKLIGKHPLAPDFFAAWVTSLDNLKDPRLQHREMTADGSGTVRQQAIDKVADWILTYHLTEGKKVEIQAKKLILDKYGFKNYIQTQAILPKADKTQKGNGAEVILTEYLKSCSSLGCLIYKLHYNSNIEQSMKGDDVLLLNERNPGEKIIVGESKFQKTPNKDLVDKITKKMGTKVIEPISLGFIVDRLREKGQKKLAKEIADVQARLPLGNTEIINVGYMMSNLNLHGHVTTHGANSNSKLVMISHAIDDPETFIQDCFKKANEKIEGIDSCPIHRLPLEYVGEFASAKFKELIGELKALTK